MILTWCVSDQEYNDLQDELSSCQSNLETANSNIEDANNTINELNGQIDDVQWYVGWECYDLEDAVDNMQQWDPVDTVE